MKLFPGFCYCIDTSALIDLKESYPKDVFPSVWNNLERLVNEGRLFAPKEVLKELEKIEDILLDWAKKQKKMFIGLNSEQVSVAQAVLKKFPRLVDQYKQNPDADPFIVALAMTESSKIITSELEGSTNRPRIPDVSKHYKIECLSLVDFFRDQKWEY